MVGSLRETIGSHDRKEISVWNNKYLNIIDLKAKCLEVLQCLAQLDGQREAMHKALRSISRKGNLVCGCVCV